MKQIKFTKAEGDLSVKVNNKNTPSLTAISNDMRDMDEKNLRFAIKLAKMQRKLDKKYAKLKDDQDVCGRLVMLSRREFRQSIKLGMTLRKSDLELTKSELVEKRAKQARFDKAQQEA